MTEAEWQAAEFFPPMLDHIRGRATTHRYLLLTVALCRRIWDRFPLDDCRELIEAVEQLADHPQVSEEDYGIVAEAESIYRRLKEGFMRVHEEDEHVRGPYIAALACGAMWHDPDGTIESVAESAAIAIAAETEGPVWEAERQAQARLLNELFGNPFHPVAFDPAWRSETVVALATGIYAERAFDRLPILADALEEAGCDHADVLAHCRCPGPHVRGCWVVDLHDHPAAAGESELGGRERQYPPNHDRCPDVDASSPPTSGPAKYGVRPFLLEPPLPPADGSERAEQDGTDRGPRLPGVK